MTVILALPELRDHDFELGLDRPSITVKGVGDPVPPEADLTARLRIGGPLVVPISESDVAGDPDLLALMRYETASHRFHAVHVACTFTPQGDERFIRAWVGFELTSDEGEAPIAWSMTPDKLTHPLKLTGSVELGADVKFVGMKSTGTQEREIDEAYLVAINLLRADPTWEFSATPSQPLDVSQRLSLIVQRRANLTGRGKLRLRALVQRRHFKAFPYDVSLTAPDTPLSFPLP